MKIILTSVGTRGDMEPFLAVGEILKQKGHQVICAFPEQFRELAEDTGLEFSSLGSKYIELLESDAGLTAMGGGTGIKRLFAYLKLARKQTESNKEFVRKLYELIQCERPDRIVYSAKSVFPVIWELNNTGKSTLLSPLPFMHYVEGHAFILFSGNYGKFLNKLSFSLLEFGIVTTTIIAQKWLDLPIRYTRKEVYSVIRSRKTIYTISPILFPRQNDWNESIKVLGYQERDKTLTWRPDVDLVNFIEKNHKILFITFGSMNNPDPQGKTKIILDILVRNNISAIINTASGGLVAPMNFVSEKIIFIDQIPYDWIFPKMYAVIHHGGSGTTHLALKYACPSMIIPHVVDQFVWDRIVNEQVCGPKGMRINKISAPEFEEKIKSLMSRKLFKERAEQIAVKMNLEKYKEEIYRSIIYG